MSETQGPTVIAVAAVFAVLLFFTLILRIYARVAVVKSVGPDDYLIIVAALLSWAFIACVIKSVEHGLGSHYPEVIARGTENFITYMQVVWLSSIFYNACLGFIKISVLALYMRLGDRKLRRVAMVMCAPVSAAYDIRILPADKKCIDINAFYLANAAVNIFTDILTYTLPIPLVVKLQIPRQQKIGLAVILGLGLFACVSSIIRITYIPQMLVSDDPTWAITGAMYWSVIETNIGILAASIPSYKAIAKRYAPRLLGTSSNGSHKRSVFKMMKGGSGGPSQHTGGDMKPTSTKPAFSTFDTHATNDNSSEEVLFTPTGRIGVKTEIVHQFEEAGNGQDSFGGGLPLQGVRHSSKPDSALGRSSASIHGGSRSSR
ncbi:Satratoxin biosynthesis SC1 cluster protein 4 like [Verticillium longisporum]|uniref:Satratoxin biosynthesis SC1 cluster protein 4 like n=1 Tax=Verticillium longisporum TaxID=100787 RepID=A0A8I2ZFJ9_VERLO|nr:Satratoxin biosynthesis SC1 cluster protein 4 like [Verticillium longisporum]